MANIAKLRSKPHTTAAIKLALDHEARIANLELYQQAVYDLLVYLTTPEDEQVDQVQILHTRREEIESTWHDDDSADEPSAPAGTSSRAGSARVLKTT